MQEARLSYSLEIVLKKRKEKRTTKRGRGYAAPFAAFLEGGE